MCFYFACSPTVLAPPVIQTYDTMEFLERLLKEKSDQCSGATPALLTPPRNLKKIVGKSSAAAAMVVTKRLQRTADLYPDFDEDFEEKEGGASRRSKNAPLTQSEQMQYDRLGHSARTLSTRKSHLIQMYLEREFPHWQSPVTAANKRSLIVGFCPQGIH